MVETPKWNIEGTLAAEDGHLFKATGTIIFTPLPEAKAPNPIEPIAIPEAPIETKEKKENPDRITITGRIGITPEVVDTANGKRMLKLPIATKVEGQEKPKWEQVFFFGERADKIAGEVHKGQFITVIGYRKEVEQSRKMPDGKYGKVKAQVIYGAAVSDPNKKKE